MEFRDLIALFKKEAGLFWGVVIAVLVAAFFWQGSQAPVFEANKLVNIGRTGVQVTNEYTFDSFYRLQADERFADTVVRWLDSPRVVEDIALEARLAPGHGLAFTGKRLSSQMVEVTYQASNEKTLDQVSQALETVLGRYTKSLNLTEKDQGWFAIIGSDPVIRDARIPLWPVVAFGLVVGIFAAFWLVLLRHYFQPTKNSKQ